MKQFRYGQGKNIFGLSYCSWFREFGNNAAKVAKVAGSTSPEWQYLIKNAKQGPEDLMAVNSIVCMDEAHQKAAVQNANFRNE
jgi:hypothetical protein